MNCECGCGFPAPVYRGRQCRYLRGHCGANKTRKKNRYVVEDGTGCWIWLLGTRDGYGKERVGHKVGGAHIHSYERHRGPVPDGMVLDHVVCGNRRCVNPWHLEVVTSTVNSRRGRNAKINQQVADEIRRMKASGMTRSAIARVFGVSESLVSDVVRGNTWTTPEQEATKASVTAATEDKIATGIKTLVPAALRPIQPPVVTILSALVVRRRKCYWSSPSITSVGGNNDSLTRLTCRQRPLPTGRSPPRLSCSLEDGCTHWRWRYQVLQVSRFRLG
jgi:hypothetical protein